MVRIQLTVEKRAKRMQYTTVETTRLSFIQNQIGSGIKVAQESKWLSNQSGSGS